MTAAATDPYAFPTLDPARVVVPGVVERGEDLVATAHAQAGAIREGARALGYQEGWAAAMAEVLAQLEPGGQAVEAAVRALVDEARRVAEEAERAAVELGLAIAEKVLGAQLELRPELVLDVVTGTLRGCLERERLVVQVHPDDYDLVRREADEIADRLGGVGRLEVASERRVPRGGCIVRTVDGEIDARIDEQLLRARELLHDALRAERP